MRIALITDLHLGLATTGEYHNRLLGKQVGEIATVAVAALNRTGADLSVMLGDITHAGLDSELDLAKGLFDRLQMPWYVLPGNHDTDAVNSGGFDQVFGSHAARGYIRCGDSGMLFPRDVKPDASPASELFLIGASQASTLIASAAADAAPRVLIFGHAPLVGVKSQADAHGGRYAGHFTDGEAFVEQLAVRCAPRRPLIFCGHLHFHCVMATPGWVQCTTAALIEYPMELRLVTLAEDKVTIETLPAAPPDLAARSLRSVDSAWVAGQACDRQWQGSSNE